MREELLALNRTLLELLFEVLLIFDVLLMLEVLLVFELFTDLSDEFADEVADGCLLPVDLPELFGVTVFSTLNTLGDTELALV